MKTLLYILANLILLVLFIGGIYLLSLIFPILFASIFFIAYLISLGV